MLGALRLQDVLSKDPLRMNGRDKEVGRVEGLLSECMEPILV